MLLRTCLSCLGQVLFRPTGKGSKRHHVFNMKSGLLGCTAMVCKQRNTQQFSQRHRITEDLSVWHWPSAALRVQFSSSSLNITNAWMSAASLKSISSSARNRESQRCYAMESIKMSDKSATAWWNDIMHLWPAPRSVRVPCRTHSPAASGRNAFDQGPGSWSLPLLASRAPAVWQTSEGAQQTQAAPSRHVSGCLGSSMYFIKWT